jgi:hypothetical protein
LQLVVGVGRQLIREHRLDEALRYEVAKRRLGAVECV